MAWSSKKTRIPRQSLSGASRGRTAHVSLTPCHLDNTRRPAVLAILISKFALLGLPRVALGTQEARYVKNLPITIALLLLLSPLAASAAIIDVFGGASNRGALAEIIDAPADLSDAGHTNDGQQGFNERQGVVLAQSLVTDAGRIDVGTRVDSHMILLNTANNALGVHRNVLWTFATRVLGVISGFNGRTLDASEFLGAPTSIYPGAFYARGMEGSDSYEIMGNQLLVDMRVTTPGDWIRVITESGSATVVADVPEPGVYTLLVLGVAALVWRRKLIGVNDRRGQAEA